METRQKKGKTKDTQKGKNAEKNTGKEEEVPSPSKETQGGMSGASQCSDNGRNCSGERTKSNE